MFCPVCKAEYRAGFTQCSDCGAALVESLDAADPAPKEQERQLDAVQIWSGTDPQTFTAVRDALDWARICHFAQTRAPGAVPGLKGQFYSVLVHRDDRNAAAAVLQTLGRRADSDNSAAEDDSGAQPEESDELEGSDDLGPAPDDVAEDFHEGDATAEIWSGDDRGMAETVSMCLRENGIGCVVEKSGGNRLVLVMPESEARAREIVREIVEGTPLK
jgi:hypothetical protein